MKWVQLFSVKKEKKQNCTWTGIMQCLKFEAATNRIWDQSAIIHETQFFGDLAHFLQGTLEQKNHTKLEVTVGE